MLAWFFRLFRRRPAQGGVVGHSAQAVPSPLSEYPPGVRVYFQPRPAHESAPAPPPIYLGPGFFVDEPQAPLDAASPPADAGGGGGESGGAGASGGWDAPSDSGSSCSSSDSSSDSSCSTSD
jgi:hypothetical protein